jgi:hypothetical protein
VYVATDRLIRWLELSRKTCSNGPRSAKTQRLDSSAKRIPRSFVPLLRPPNPSVRTLLSQTKVTGK